MMSSLRKIISFILQTLIICGLIMFASIQFESVQLAIVNIFLPTQNTVAFSQFEGVFPFWGKYRSIIYRSSGQDLFRITNLSVQLAADSIWGGKLHLKNISAEKIEVLKLEMKKNETDPLLPSIPDLFTLPVADRLEIKEIIYRQHHINMEGRLLGREDALGMNLLIQDLKKRKNASKIDFLFEKGNSLPSGKLYVHINSFDDAGLISELFGLEKVHVNGELSGRLDNLKGQCVYRVGNEQLQGQLDMTSGLQGPNQDNGINIRFRHHYKADNEYSMSGEAIIMRRGLALDVEFPKTKFLKDKKSWGDFKVKTSYENALITFSDLSWNQILSENETAHVKAEKVLLNVKKQSLQADTQFVWRSGKDGKNQQTLILNSPAYFDFKKDKLSISAKGRLTLPNLHDPYKKFSQTTLVATLEKDRQAKPIAFNATLRASDDWIGLNYKEGGRNPFAAKGQLFGREFDLLGTMKDGRLDLINNPANKSNAQQLFKLFKAHLDFSNPDYPLLFNADLAFLQNDKISNINTAGWVAKGYKFVALDQLKVGFRESFLEASGDYNIDRDVANCVWHLYSFNIGDFIPDKNGAGTFSLNGDLTWSREAKDITFSGDFHKLYWKGMAAERGSIEGRLNLISKEFSSTLSAQKALVEEVATIEDFSATSVGQFSNFSTSISMRGVADRALKGNLAFFVKDLNRVELDTVSVQFGQHKVMLARPVIFRGDLYNWNFSPMQVLVDRGSIILRASRDSEVLKLSTELENMPASFLNDITSGGFFLKGEVSGKGSFVATSSALKGDLNLDLRGGDAVSFIRSSLQDHSLVIDTGIQTNHLKLTAKGTLPVIWELKPLALELDMTQPFDLALQAEGKLDDVQGVFDLNHDHVKGEIFGDVKLFGTLNEQKSQGQIQIHNGEYHRQDIGLKLGEIIIDLYPKGSGFVLKDKVKFSDNFNGVGYINSAFLGFGENLVPKINVDIEFWDASIINIPNTSQGGMSARATGRLLAEGSMLDLKISSNAKITHLRKYIGDNSDSETPIAKVNEKHLYQRQSQTLSSNASDATSLRIYDIHLQLDEPFEVSGQGLTSTWTGNLSILGNSAQPQYKGEFKLEKGTLRILDRFFDVDKGSIIFDGDLDPQLYIESNLEDQNMKVKVTLEGDTSQLTKRITSDNNLSEQEILQRLFFSRDSKQTQWQAFAVNYLFLNSLLSTLSSVVDVGYYTSTDPLTHQEKEILSFQFALVDPTYLRVDYSMVGRDNKLVDSENFLFAIGVKPTNSIKTELNYSAVKGSRVGVSVEWGYDF